MGNNLQRLGNTLADRMNRTAGAAVPITIELGTINGNMSLKTDSLQAQIPKGDYLVALTNAGTDYKTGEADGHTHDLPSNIRALQAGDRVLVAWCGNDAVVIAIVTSS